MPRVLSVLVALLLLATPSAAFAQSRRRTRRPATRRSTSTSRRFRAPPATSARARRAAQADGDADARRSARGSSASAPTARRSPTPSTRPRRRAQPSAEAADAADRRRAARRSARCSTPRPATTAAAAWAWCCRRSCSPRCSASSRSSSRAAGRCPDVAVACARRAVVAAARRRAAARWRPRRARAGARAARRSASSTASSARHAAERAPWLTRARRRPARTSCASTSAGSRPTRRPARRLRRAATPPTRAYDFRRADAAIVDATARGLRVLASFTGAPRWAEGADRPADAPTASWKPDPAALEEYGAALARRYSGTFPDPARPGLDAAARRGLPALERAEPRQVPQPAVESAARRSRPRTTAACSRAFYRGVKSVNPAALVVTGGTGPFGDPGTDGHRIMPARFVREMLCLREPASAAPARHELPAPARFDVLAHHPYSVGSPRRKALNADDVSIPDMGKLTRLLRAAERTGRALPRKRHRAVGHRGLLRLLAARSRRRAGRRCTPATSRRPSTCSGARASTRSRGFRSATRLPAASYADDRQSGIYFADGRPKIAAARVPLPARRRARRRARSLRVWGRAPVAGIGAHRATRRPRGWRLVRKVRAKRRAHVPRADRRPAPDAARARRRRDEPDLARALTRRLSARTRPHVRARASWHHQLEENDVKRVLIALSRRGRGAVRGTVAGAAAHEPRQRVSSWPDRQQPVLPGAAAQLRQADGEAVAARATFLRQDRTISILAPITALASGRAAIELHAASRRTNYTLPVDRREPAHPRDTPDPALAGELRHRHPARSTTRATPTRARRSCVCAPPTTRRP